MTNHLVQHSFSRQRVIVRQVEAFPNHRILRCAIRHLGGGHDYPIFGDIGGK